MVMGYGSCVVMQDGGVCAGSVVVVSGGVWW